MAEDDQGEGPRYRNDPAYRDMRSSEGRLFVAPHMGQHPGMPPCLIMPAMAMTLGKTTLGKGDIFHPTITMFALGQPAALCFLPNADELEAFADAMRTMAATMRAEADALVADVLARKPGSDDGQA